MRMKTKIKASSKVLSIGKFGWSGCLLILLLSNISLVNAQYRSYSLWSLSTTPSIAIDPDPNSVELGVKFRANVNGSISEIRFYRAVPIESGYQVRLWKADGTLLQETSLAGGRQPTPGWQRAIFIEPVQIQAGQTYVASYYASTGKYSVDEDYFTNTGVGNVLRALQDGEEGGNGVYFYGDGGGFPSETYRSSNYWVDVVFTSSSAPTTPVTPPRNLVAAVSNATEVDLVSWIPSGEGSGESGGNAPYHSVYRDGELIATLPGNLLFYRDTQVAPNSTHTYQVRGRSSFGTVTAPSNSVTVTTPALRTLADCPCSLWSDDARPQFENADRTPAERGLKFRSDASGQVTKIRLYKGSTSGSHVGHLWTESGTLLATTVEKPASPGFGWIELSFSAPVPIDADTNYVVSYFTPRGGNAFTLDYFSLWFNAVVDNYPLHADNTNGLIRTGSSGFPTVTADRTMNFWVDVVFEP